MREDVIKAAEILKSSGVVALPTETVYGLAANARHDAAVRQIFDLKGRPSHNPLIVHVSGLAMGETIGDFSPLSRRLAEVFWPGALTIVVPLRADAGISELVTAGHATIALRAPAHPLMQMVLQNSGLALAAPSANISGRISPTTAQHVIEALPGVSFVLDGGAAEKGLESTIIMMDENDRVIHILRPGPISAEALSSASGVEVRTALVDNDAPLAPGGLLKHYSPNALVRLDVVGPVKDGGLLAFGREEQPGEAVVYNLSETGDLEEAARNLFAGLYWLDAQGVGTIAVRTIPHVGIGAAIHDRLARAAFQDNKADRC